MQQFALASVYPRSIAWLVRLDEWDRFEEIIHYNCAMVGGYFNVIIPLTEQDDISEEYQQFLVDYDPDFIVLAPNMVVRQLDKISTKIYSFSIVSWDSVSRIADLDPWSGGTGLNVTLGLSVFDKNNNTPSFPLIAVADSICPDASRFALLACGDVKPRSPMISKMDEEVRLDATGHREHFLAKAISKGYTLRDTGAYLSENDEFIPAPNRNQLSELILDEYKFPLSGPTKILESSCRLQHSPSLYQSFIGLTATYSKGGTPARTYNHRGKDTPSMVILISDDFSLTEAVLFWNLRASKFATVWLSFSECEKDLGSMVKWLESDYGEYSIR